MESIAKHIVEPNQLQRVAEGLLAKSRLCGKETSGIRLSSTYYILDRGVQHAFGNQSRLDEFIILAFFFGAHFYHSKPFSLRILSTSSSVSLAHFAK